MKLIISYLPEWLYRYLRWSVPTRLCSGTRWVCKRQRPRGGDVWWMLWSQCHRNISSLKDTQTCIWLFCLLFKHVMLLQNDALTALTWTLARYMYHSVSCNLLAAAGLFVAKKQSCALPPLAIPRCKNHPSARAKSPWWLLVTCGSNLKRLYT